MTVFLNLTQARDKFPQVIKKISKGENVVITKRGKLVALISPLNEEELETDAILNNPHLMWKIKRAKKDISKFTKLQVKRGIDKLIVNPFTGDRLKRELKGLRKKSCLS